MEFITNFQSPVELNDLIDRFDSDGLTNIDHLFNFSKTRGEWTVDKEANVGDTVFFMCAKTSKDHMGHVCAQARETEIQEIIDFAEEKRKLYKQYAGQIMALGRVEQAPFMSPDPGYAHAHWKSPWYAKIGDFTLLENPVSIDEFRDFIKVSRTGAITRLEPKQAEQLLELIRSRNNIANIY